MAEFKLVCEGDTMGTCNPKDCAVHEYVLNALDRFDTMANKLAEGQQQLQLNIVKLTENLEGVKRLHERVDKAEARVGELEKFMYKAIGGLGVVTLILPLIINYFL